jgi:hypothetical protein
MKIYTFVSALGLALGLLFSLISVVSAETPWKMQAISTDGSVVITLLDTPCVSEKIIEKLKAGSVTIGGVSMDACWSGTGNGGVAIVAESREAGELDPSIFHTVEDI